MKVIKLFICLLFVLNSALQAQQEPEMVSIPIQTLRDFNLRGKVKVLLCNDNRYIFSVEGNLQLSESSSCIENYIYDKDGRLLELKERYSGENIVRTKTYTYSAQGLLVGMESIGPYPESFFYVYDMNGHVSQVKHIFHGMEGVQMYENTYDARKRIIKRRASYSSSNMSTSSRHIPEVITYLTNGWVRCTIRNGNGDCITEFDERGQERSEVIRELKNNSCISTSTRKYDEKGNMIESLRTGSNIDIWDKRMNKIKQTFIYNELEELTSLEYYDNIDGSRETRYDYTQRDSMGNWIERTITNQNTNEQRTETRDITYYETK